MLAALDAQPGWFNYVAAFLASCVSTSIMHPLDTIKTREIAGLTRGGASADDFGSSSSGGGGGDGGDGGDGSDLGLGVGVGVGFSDSASSSRSSSSGGGGSSSSSPLRVSPGGTSSEGVQGELTVTAATAVAKAVETPPHTGANPEANGACSSDGSTATVGGRAACEATVQADTIVAAAATAEEGQQPQQPQQQEGLAGAAEGEEGGLMAGVRGYLGLYQGITGALIKEGPPSALYLGVYEAGKSTLLAMPAFAQTPLIVYLISGALGECVGSVVRAPAEAIKSRVQSGLDSSTADSFKSVIGDPEGRANIVRAWYQRCGVSTFS